MSPLSEFDRQTSPGFGVEATSFTVVDRWSCLQYSYPTDKLNALTARDVAVTVLGHVAARQCCHL
jgi:hypothetical protein